MTVIHNRKYIVFFSILLVLICGVTFYTIISFGNKNAEIQQISGFSSSRDYPATEELSEMVYSAEAVVIGKYVGFDSSWNMARNPSNAFEEDAEHYVEGRLYSFEVEDVLKGDLAAGTVLVNHRYSEIKKMTESNAVVNAEGIILSEATKTNDISFTLTDGLYIEPEIGAKYILFLLKDKDFGNYYGSIEPFAIKIIDNVAQVQSNLINSAGVRKQAVAIDGTSRTIVVTEHCAPLNDRISGIDFNLLKKEIIDISTQK